MTPDFPAVELTFLSAGYCQQKARMAGRLERGWIKFHAVFCHLKHPVHGSYLIDTGYGPRYLQVVSSFPERIMNWLLPTTLSPGDGARYQLTQHGFPVDQLQGVLLSHFHGDHIGGLSEIESCPIISRRSAYQASSREGRFSQVARGFLRGLLPDDFESRVRWIEETDFVEGDPELPGFRVYDFWGDGTLKWVDLPGHAPGHVGYLIRSSQQTLFYVVDACWDVEAMESGRRLPWLARRVQHDAVDYEATQQKLVAWHRQTGIPIVACHCQRTISRVISTLD